MLSMLVLNFLGLDCVDNLRRLEGDEGLCALFGRHEARFPGISRRKQDGCHRKAMGGRTFPRRARCRIGCTRIMMRRRRRNV